MTFCVGIKVQEGLVMLADTQIVRGNEQINKAKLSVSKHHDSTLFTMTSGLRSIRDKSITYLEEQLQGTKGFGRLYQVVNLFGEQLRRVRKEDGPSLAQSNFSFNLNAIIGGCLSDDTEPKLYYVYPEGNWIEASPDSPYFLIGRTPYGKPILDRLLRYDTSLESAVALALLSFDATRSSVTDVECPIDIGIVFASKCDNSLQRFEASDIATATKWWSDRLADALREFPSDWSKKLFS